MYQNLRKKRNWSFVPLRSVDKYYIIELFTRPSQLCKHVNFLYDLVYNILPTTRQIYGTTLEINFCTNFYSSMLIHWPSTRCRVKLFLYVLNVSMASNARVTGKSRVDVEQGAGAESVKTEIKEKTGRFAYGRWRWIQHVQFTCS